MDRQLMVGTEGLVTVAQAARMFAGEWNRLEPNARKIVDRAIRRGDLASTKIGDFRFVQRAEVSRWMEDYRPHVPDDDERAKIKALYDEKGSVNAVHRATGRSRECVRAVLGQ